MTSTSITHLARILVCSTCDGNKDRAVAEEAIQTALMRAGLADRVSVDFGGCIGACANPAVVGLQSEGRASYVFSGIDLVQDAPDIAATFDAYLEARKGWIVNAHACGRLRHCLLARLPALP